MITSKHNKYYSFLPIIKRHLHTTWPFLNFKKIQNIILAKFEEKLKVIKVKSSPYFIKIEPTNKCNLMCTGCLHAVGRTELQDKNYLGEMNFDLFKKIINELEKYLVKVSLYVEGEPLIYSKIVEMIKYLSDRKIASVISSNFNYLTLDLADAMVKNKLTHLIISMDGWNEETYKKYRQGGSFKKVVENIKLIQEEKQKQKSKYPIIEIQAIKFDYTTEGDIKKIKKIAKELEANQFSIKDDLVEHYKNPKPKEKNCFWLYSSSIFHWNGTVQPCCFYYDKQDNNFADIKINKFKDIWNNKKFKQARKYFKTGEKEDQNIKCYNCLFFKK